MSKKETNKVTNLIQGGIIISVILMTLVLSINASSVSSSAESIATEVKEDVASNELRIMSDHELIQQIQQDIATMKGRQIKKSDLEDLVKDLKEIYDDN